MNQYKLHKHAYILSMHYPVGAYKRNGYYYGVNISEIGGSAQPACVDYGLYARICRRNRKRRHAARHKLLVQVLFVRLHHSLAVEQAVEEGTECVDEEHSRYYCY